jgi:Ca-activated chloride channel family protein
VGQLPDCRRFTIRFKIWQVVNQWEQSQNQLQVAPVLRRFPLTAFFLAVAASMSAAQGDVSAPRDAPPIQHAVAVEAPLLYEKTTSLKVDVNLVLVPVTVTDRQDRVVLGLERNNFTVFDGGNQQVIRHFSSEDAPVSLGIIFDTSSSMYGKMERSREAVGQLLRSSNPNDEFFLIGFANRPELLVDFTSSADAIQEGISTATPDGSTSLWDAVYLGLDKMRDAHNERKALLIISDGGENHSRYSMKDVWSVVLEAGVQVYAMGIFDEAPRTKAERIGPDLLRALTEVSGGKTFPVRSLKKIGDAAGQLAIELRNQYLIDYLPTPFALDGKWHRLAVRVAPTQSLERLHVYAKAGYYSQRNKQRPTPTH